MFELASAMFSIADANEFRFARFYIVCEAVALGALKSPLIVCGLSDTHRESPNVEETRNQMQTSGRKKCSHFFQIIVSYAFQLKSTCCVFWHITYRFKIHCPLKYQPLLGHFLLKDHAKLPFQRNIQFPQGVIQCI